MDNVTAHHLARLKNQTIEKFSVADIPRWICKQTLIKGMPYSFVDHEYQEKILSDTSQEVVARKCSQVGMTEASVRFALALCGVTPHYSVIYTLPTATQATHIMQTRVDPIIKESPYLSDMIQTSLDNASVKQLGNSFLYMKGAASGNAPISTPADHLIHDEVDFSDPGILEQYHSRLTHSHYKRKTKLSTPTIPGVGIDKEFTESRRHFNMVKCCHCNFWFVPDYFHHVRLPGYDGDLRALRKADLKHADWRNARLECPRCHKEPSLQVEHREWVCENPDSGLVAAGYQITPFDAPNAIKCPTLPIEQVTVVQNLVLASTSYDRISQFVNYNLGLPMADSESSITADDLLHLKIPRSEVGSASYVMGLDMGLVCHAVIAAVLPDGRLIVVHAEKIPLSRVRDRRQELANQYWPRMTVVDALPYTETVMRMQDQDRNLFAAVYTEASRSLETHKVVDKEEDREIGQEDLRQVNVNRNKAFDALMADIKDRSLLHMTGDYTDDWCDHLQDMKRTQHFTKEGELSYVWVKSSEGNDHYHHATLYAWVASKMLGVSRSQILLPRMVSSFRMKRR